MARQTGLLKFEGTIGGMTFYKSKDGYLVKEKGGVNGERIMTDPRFARTRENCEEFKIAAQSGKLLRDSIRSFMLNASDPRITSRLTKTMAAIAKLDATSVRGKRNPGNGLSVANGKALIKSFNFNEKSILGAVLYKTWAITPATSVVTIANLTPLTDIVAPVGATHFSISAAVEAINLTTGVYDTKFTNVVNAAIGNTVVPVVLTPTAVPTGTGVKMYYLKVEFFQMINGVQYALKNGAYNSLAVIEVA